MANIIKKLKRKHRKRKQQYQRAKLEQEQRKLAEMSPEEAYRSRLTKHRRTAVKKTLLTVGAVVIVVILVLFYIEKRSYHNYKILSASEQEDVVSTNYVEMSGKILRYSPDGASLVNSSMDTYWSSLYEMQNPVADVNDDYAVIADQDGTLLEMYDKDGETGSVTTSYNIIKARISSSGMVAAILDGGDSTWINFYASDGSLIAENQTHISDPGYPLDVAVSNSGDIMMVAYQFVDGSQTTSYVAFYNFGDVGQSEDDRIVSGYTYDGVVVPQIMYLSGDRAVAIRDDGFTLYKGQQIPKESTTIKVDKEIVSTFYDDNIIGLVFKNGNKDKPYTMRAYSTNGTMKFEKDFNIPYTSIKVSDGSILLYNSSQICVMNSRGVEKYSGTVDGTISDFIKTGWNRYLLILDNGVDVIKFS
ncbi:DUF5711 family protein [Blautia sp. MSJ-19]|uniref:DUF5711 family protein n=1 Tax=Blautia sp. MSJ-19 TaxID=2841517 RepID=UPI001C0EE6EB|nr:DUF5711 family protein [Blautia sp. MSJ-19]MBU5482497.1 hypothetical protein [Blautia sp. MSJ-19]